MALFDVFNGDADGLCALQQLYLADPRDATLVTGVKRDIALLDRIKAGTGDQVTALDISLDKNRDALLRLLEAGARVLYVDHHYPGKIPQHPALETAIDTAADRGTSLLVDDLLAGRFRAWAVVGTYGDNFDAAAHRAAEPLGLAPERLDLLRELGILLNYNSYGKTVDDLHLPPATLHQRMRGYDDPFGFIDDESVFGQLRDGYRDDMARARATEPELQTEHHAVVILPATAWARRIIGPYANELAQAAPQRAHALLTEEPGGGFTVSVRAPIARPDGADALCRQFPSGGGRKAAAGVNHLPSADLGRFIISFQKAFA